jgi:IS5 family transposase
MFLILLVKELYDLSDRQLEEELTVNLAFMKFCMLSIDSPTPDHSTICRWRDRFIEYNVFEKALAEFNRQLESYGLDIRTGTIVDATLIKSHARPRKKVMIESEPTGDDVIPEVKVHDNPPEQLLNSPQNTSVKEEFCKDPDARWIKKGKKSVLGYKGHLGVSKDGIVTALVTTPANVWDGNVFEEVIDQAKPTPNSPVLADKGYDSQKNRDALEARDLIDMIMRKKVKNSPPDIFMPLRNKLISTVRYVVERTVGGLKKRFRIGRSRYIGIKKTHNRNVLCALGYNMIRAVNLLQYNCVQLEKI